MEDQYTRWVYTSFQNPLNVKWPDKCRLDFHIYQREWTTTLRPHYQGYIEFERPYSKTQIKRITNATTDNIFLEPAEKSREHNIMYCTKPIEYAGERSMISGEQIVFVLDDPEEKYLTWNKIKKIIRCEECA